MVLHENENPIDKDGGNINFFDMVQQKSLNAESGNSLADKDENREANLPTNLDLEMGLEEDFKITEDVNFEPEDDELIFKTLHVEEDLNDED